jgi:hypothetical protein
MFLYYGLLFELLMNDIDCVYVEYSDPYYSNLIFKKIFIIDFIRNRVNKLLYQQQETVSANI